LQNRFYPSAKSEVFVAEVHQKPIFIAVREASVTKQNT
jgi:hypothetical protein